MKLSNQKFRVFDSIRAGHKAVITGATLHVPVATMNVENYTRLLEECQKQNELKFHYLKTEVITRTITKNAETFESDQLFVGEVLPLKMLVVLVRKRAFDGDYIW